MGEDVLPPVCRSQFQARQVIPRAAPSVSMVVRAADPNSLAPAVRTEVRHFQAGGPTGGLRL